MRSHEALKAWADTLPKREITSEEGVYLVRYTVKENPDGGHVYLHEILRPDYDRDFHNHPWKATCIILCGGYTEERLQPDPDHLPPMGKRWTMAQVHRDRIHLAGCTYLPGSVNVLNPNTFHRINQLHPEYGPTWSLVITGPRVQSWGFLDRVSWEFTPWREQAAKRGLPLANFSSFHTEKGLAADAALAGEGE